MLEVRKTHKWEQRDGTTVIGIGGIGGTMEAGESPLQALQREAVEEIGCEIVPQPSRRTALESPVGIQIATDVRIDGLSPAMIWVVTDPTYKVGAKVAVFLGQAVADPQPGDLPALLLAEPAWIRQLSEEPVSIRETLDAGVEVRSKVELPEDAAFQPANTLRRLLVLRDQYRDVFEEFMRTDHLS